MRAVEGREGLSVNAPHAYMAKLETLTNPLLCRLGEAQRQDIFKAGRTAGFNEAAIKTTAASPAAAAPSTEE